MNRLLAVIGPTTVGKTALAIELARTLGDAELINADSRQVIAGLRVGTATPHPDQLGSVVCHCLDLRSPDEKRFSVWDWLVHARAALDAIHSHNRAAVLVGGTGLYVSALLDGFNDRDGVPDSGRRRERDSAVEEGRLSDLVEELEQRDPAAMVAIDINNPRRVIRALELLDRGAPGVAQARRRTGGRPAVRLGLDVERDVHLTWIRERIETIFTDGSLLTETEAAIQRGTSAEALSTCGMGYSEALGVLAGTLTVEAAIEATVVRTRRYAKAQRTWFRRDPAITWLENEPGLPISTLANQALGLLEDPKHPFA